MNQDLARILSLRKVLERAGEGSGVARSIVQEMGRGGGPGKEAARLLLLGNSIPASMASFAGLGPEVSMLASLIVAAPSSSAPLVGRSGGALAMTLQRWVKAKENRALELRVMRFRSLVTSGVLGAVTAMIASLGPLIGSFGMLGGIPSGSGALPLGAAAMTAISSGMLGAFMSGKGFYLNVIVSLGAYFVVFAASSPLASVPAVGLWGVI